MELTEGDIKRTIVRIEPGSAPMRVAVLVDTSAAAESMISPVRSALVAFADALPAPHEIALVAIGRQPRVLQRATTDRTRMKKSMNSLFPDGGGVVLVDGMRDTVSQLMRQPEVRWPVFVVITTASTDASAVMQPDQYGRFVDELRMQGSTVHALVVQQGEFGSAVEYALNLTKNTGGMYDTVNSPNGLPERLKAFATRIVGDHQKMLSRYQIDFLGDAKAKGEIAIRMLRSDVTLGRMSLTRPF
jgi:hypothetical protein